MTTGSVFFRAYITRGAFRVSAYSPVRNVGDVVAPVITAPASGSSAENAVFAGTCTTDEYATLTITGNDGALFEVTSLPGTSHTYRFIGGAQPDFEVPGDANTKKVYEHTRLTSVNIQPGFDSANATLATVPGHAGHLFWIGGVGNDFGVDNSLYMYRSTDGCETWTKVLDGPTGIREPMVIAFGKNLDGTSCPAIAFVGYVNGIYEHWVSLDNVATWTRTAEFPADNIQFPRCMSGDMNVFGVWNIGFGGAGYGTSDYEINVHAT